MDDVGELLRIGGPVTLIAVVALVLFQRLSERVFDRFNASLQDLAEALRELRQEIHDGRARP